MPSTSKTENIGLNIWTLADRPHMADFNADNTAVEKALTEHFSDSVAHLSAEEHDNLNNRVTFVTYLGTNMPLKEIKLPCEPQFVIVFPVNKSPGGGRSSIGFASRSLCSGGLSLKDSTLTITHNEADSSTAALNTVSVSYAVAIFR